ncbi:glyoxylase-like metal-dependent hydrolase (beta-lactamase superfamily II) [Streptomyces sp. 2132.2]|uniref:MBL fold metallo-hydrolase n=1 Tax=Streptomyces sp. 2132.2 TaxID=2485161 RepID=UPI000F48DB8C|nr:MBL fold metallo-hydrolase [Streptomyces sp. 2132.2]ROQ93782.1 glyoxylase-like metal-dependent hydrolase (beta-lactamase superfamily II) [Streptomyces sp. 2132.2]
METHAIGYAVHVCDPLPLSVTEPLPNGEGRTFQPISTTLVHGERDAVLIDPPFTTDQIEEVAAWVAGRGRNIIAIIATHGHGDHWFGDNEFAERFGAPVVATAGAIAVMHGNVAARPFAWDKLWPGQIPDAPVTAVTVPDNTLTLEGHDLHLVEVGHTDTEQTSVLHVPDLGLVAAGDALYNGAHMYIGESAGGGLDAWRAAISTVEALAPRHIVAGHKNKDLDDDATRVIAGTRQYLDSAETALKKCSTATEFFHTMVARHPDLLYGKTLLWVGAKALYALREPDADPVAASVAAWF